MPQSRFDFWEVMLILDGKGWVTSGTVRHPVCKGNLVLVPAGAPYSFEDSPEALLTILCLCMAPQEGTMPIFEPVLPREFSVLRSFSLSREVAMHLQAIFYEQSQVRSGGEAVVIGQTLLLLGKLARRRESVAQEEERDAARLTPSEVQFLVRVRDYIDKLETTFHEPGTIRSVASRLGMSPRSFTHHFRSVTGESHQRYVLKLRLRQARYLLRETDDSITSIAFACGFEDLSNFFRAFRREEKMSPSQWREEGNSKEGGKTRE